MHNLAERPPPHHKGDGQLSRVYGAAADYSPWTAGTYSNALSPELTVQHVERAQGEAQTHDVQDLEWFLCPQCCSPIRATTSRCPKCSSTHLQKGQLGHVNGGAAATFPMPRMSTGVYSARLGMSRRDGRV